jgi:hypothetical protein
MLGTMDQAASTVMGTMKVAKGAIEGLSGVFTTLMKEHGRVTALLLRVKGSTDMQVRRELWPTIRAELLAHEKAELSVVYPAYRAHPETAHIAREHDVEAGQLENLIYTLDSMDVAHPSWGSTFDELVKTVQHHVLEEEREHFRNGNRVFGAQADALDRAYRQAKASYLRQLSTH